MNAQLLSRTLLAYGIALPLALVVGLILTDPEEMTNFSMLISITTLMCLPLLLRYWHPMVFFFWNSGLILGWISSSTDLRIGAAAFGFLMTVTNRIMDKNRRFVPAPSVVYPLLSLLAVVVVTAQLRGSVGIRLFGGSSYGGKNFVFLIGAILGFFAMISQAIPLDKARTYLKVFFLPGLLYALGHVALLGGPAFYFVFLFIPAGYALTEYQAEMAGGELVRMGGYTVTALTLLCYLLARYGIRGIFNAARPWRLGVLVLIFLASSLGGFRSSVVLIGAVFIIHFCLEGMWRTGLAAVLALVGAGLLVILIAFSEKMPPAVQRAFSFLPIQVSAQVLADSKGSTEWRVEMWKVVVPELPKYFWLGKGYALDPTELYLTQHAIIRGLAKNYEQALRAGTYHNGPLTVYIPLGIFGLLAFVLFVLASCRALYYNYRYGDPELQTANTLLFSVFVARTLFFFFVFGDLPTDLPTFTGLIGFGLALNGGIKKPAPVRLPGLAEVQWHRHPVLA